MVNNKVSFKEYEKSFDKEEKRYFAASNSSNGFKSYFSEIFSPVKLKMIYILKGGPGCGKSTLLKTIGEKAKELGCDYELFHCSSSPFSLDGILINNLKIAVIDGTAPHAVEPTFAGIREVIVDMGKCWDLKKLAKHGDKIIKLSEEKKAKYEIGYRFLSAAEHIEELLFDMISPAILYEKLYKSCERFCDKVISKGTVFSKDVRIVDSFGGDGNVRLSTFENIAKKNIYIKNSHNTAHIYLIKTLEICEKKKQKVIVSYSPINPYHIDGLYLPDIGLSFTLLPEKGKEHDDAKLLKIVNMERFLDREMLLTNRQKYKFGNKCSQSLKNEALLSFNAAGEIHEQIEKEFCVSTDYRIASKITEGLMKEIFI